MILLEDYKDILDYYAKTPAKMVDTQKYKYHAGTSFELDINDTIIKNYDAFFLYWQVQFSFQIPLNWSMNLSLDNYFADNIENHQHNTDVSFLFQDNNNIFTIDNMLITPYAVFILEAKNHKADNEYISKMDKWYINNNTNVNTIDNPVLQVLKYKNVVSTFMQYYKINLPIIPRVIFKQKVNLDRVSYGEKQLCMYSDNLFNLINTSKNNPFQPDEAFKFANILYYYGCHPCAYDDNKLNWSKKND